MQSPPDDPAQTFDAAVEAHRAVRLPEAEALYAQVLARDPDHVRALFNLGVLNMGRRTFAPAEALFAAVLAREPDRVQAWDYRINALIGDGRFAEAEQAVAARPDFGPAAVAAEIRLRQYRAQDFASRRDFAGAEAQLQRICALTPADPDAHNDLARLLMSAGRASAALATVAEALRLDPRHVASLINQAAIHHAQNRTAEAEAGYRRALVLEPRNTIVLRNLQALLNGQGRTAEAEVLEANAAALGAEVGEDHMARGVILRTADRHEEAIAAFEAAITLGADRAQALSRIGASQAALGRYGEAIASLDAAVALGAEDAFATYRRAFVRLVTHDFDGGWADYETRWREPAFLAEVGHVPQAVRDRLLTAPTPDQFAGRRVVAISEQGIGDQVMFASMLPDLAQAAAAVEVMCEPRLVGLFRNAFPQIEVRGGGSVGDADVVVATGSLGHAFRRRPSDFPGTPYLRPRDEVRRRWAERLGPRQGRLRVGISWRGGTVRTRAHARSTPLDAFAPLLGLPDCEFVSLQYGDAAPDVTAVNAGRTMPIRLFPAAEIDDFEELAGLVLNLDLVVSVQTALVHLAGALGAPTLAMLQKVPEWRYGATGDTLPWYDSVRLFRQDDAHDWTPVIARIVEAVRQWPSPA